jgi:hypothetical protein
MSTTRLPHLQDNCRRARELHGAGQALAKITAGRIDPTDFYRSALVQAVGALDSYIHGVILDRAAGIIMGSISGGSDDFRVGLHWNAVRQIVSAVTPADQELAIRTHVAARLSKETYQQPDDIARGLSLVGVPKVWKAAFPTTAKAQCLAVSLIVRRRNDIVHSCDVDPVTLALKPLSDFDALNAIDTVEQTVLAIDVHC